MFRNENLPNQFKSFQRKIVPNGSLAKVAKFHTNPYNSLFWVIFEEPPFCYFPPPNTSIRGKDSQM